MSNSNQLSGQYERLGWFVFFVAAHSVIYSSSTGVGDVNVSRFCIEKDSLAAVEFPITPIGAHRPNVCWTLLQKRYLTPDEAGMLLDTHSLT